jgi:lipoprotein-anchoring transpeptidase ErfK/SrfK
LRPGDSGPSVLALQQRLTELGFWLGTPDGAYATLTAHAVTAFQKANGLPRDGIAGQRTMVALDGAARPGPRSTDSVNRIEVDLKRQLLLVVADGRVRWVMDTSTGKVAGTTPAGHHRVYRQIDGYHKAPLGVLYRPKYIFEGVAVHGYPSVPVYPASHGCIRVTNSSMDWLWSSGAMPIGTDVWVY